MNTLNNWPEPPRNDDAYFPSAKYQIEKDPLYFGYFVWRRGANGRWLLLEYCLTWWGAKRLVQKELKPPKLMPQSKRWYF